MGLTRREFGMVASAVLLGRSRKAVAQPQAARTSLILARTTSGFVPRMAASPALGRLREF